MKKVEVKPGGILTQSGKQYFGGNYSFFEKLKMNGIGSPRMIYLSGIPEFDQEDKDVAGEMSFINMELMKKGIIVRLNRNNRHRCVGILFSEVSKIELTAIRVEILLPSDEDEQKSKKKVVHRGEVKIFDLQFNCYHFEVMTSEYKGCLSFFQKPVFKDLYKYEVSPAAPEKEKFI